MDRNPLLCRTFVRQAKEILSDFPQIKHQWSIDDDEDHCILDIAEEYGNGFPVTVEVFPDAITVIASGAHVHFDMDHNSDEITSQSLGLVRDLLSPAMRVREKLAGGEPYKWIIEICECGQWVTEETVGFFFWNYFAKRTEKIYQNSMLPARIE